MLGSTPPCAMVTPAARTDDQTTSADSAESNNTTGQRAPATPASPSTPLPATHPVSPPHLSRKAPLSPLSSVSSADTSVTTEEDQDDELLFSIVKKASVKWPKTRNAKTLTDMLSKPEYALFHAGKSEGEYSTILSYLNRQPGSLASYCLSLDDAVFDYIAAQGFPHINNGLEYKGSIRLEQ